MIVVGMTVIIYRGFELMLAF